MIIIDQPGWNRYDLLYRESSIAAPRPIHAGKRRSWMERRWRTLQHWLATEAGQVPTEDPYFRPLVWRLLTGLVRLYTARILLKARVRMEEMLFSLKHHWRFLNSDCWNGKGFPGISAQKPHEHRSGVGRGKVRSG